MSTELKFYVLRSDFNGRTIESFNIFRNGQVLEWMLKEIPKYLDSPNTYEYKSFDNKTLHGFEAFCEVLRSAIAWQERGRVEYEILVGDVLEEDINKFKKVDCYIQALPNIPAIAREILYQYSVTHKKYRSKLNEALYSK